MLPVYLDEGRLPIDDEFYDIRPIWTNDNLFKTLTRQQNLDLAENTETISVYENRDFLPHIYPASTLIAVNGSTSEMFTLLSSDMVSLDNKAVFLSEQLNQAQWHFIENFVKKSFATEKPPAIVFKKVNPTKYQVEVQNATQPFFIIFNENYDPQWNAYVENRATDFTSVVASYPSLNVKEADHQTNFTPDDISYLFNTPINEQYHFLANGYANAWYINPQQLNNGNTQFTITLYYLPQSYYYLGLLITGITICICLSYLIYSLKPWNLQIKRKLQMLIPRKFQNKINMNPKEKG
jgi:hypothetical protein